MRVLALLGDSVTTDHISPAGSIPAESPAGRYLISLGVKPADFNSYGARRGNHEVMVRGTLANIRLRNQLAPGTEGGWTVHLPDGEQMWIYDASVRYQQEGVPLMIIAGKEYGSGSSRDWAAKGVLLLGVKAVLAESFERIHRTNLVGMGVLPLQFLEGQNAQTLQADGQGVVSRGRASPKRCLAALGPTVRAVDDSRRGEALRSAGASGHPAGGRILPERRHSALCPASTCRRARDRIKSLCGYVRSRILFFIQLRCNPGIFGSHRLADCHRPGGDCGRIVSAADVPHDGGGIRAVRDVHDHAGHGVADATGAKPAKAAAPTARQSPRRWCRPRRPSSARRLTPLAEWAEILPDFAERCAARNPARRLRPENSLLRHIPQAIFPGVGFHP